MEEEKQDEGLKQNPEQSGDPQAGQEEKDLKPEDGSSSGPEEGSKGQEDYYKQELEKVQKDRDNYKEGLLSKKEENKKLKEQNPSLSQEEIDKMMDDKLAEREQQIRADFTKQQLEDEVSRMTSDPSKQELIKEHYNNSIVKSGSLKEDLERALLLADKKKIFEENQELRNTLSARNSISNASQGSTAQRDSNVNPEESPTLSPQDNAFVDRINQRRRTQGKEELKPGEILGK